MSFDTTQASIDPIQELDPPVDQIAMVMVPNGSGQRPLTERERMQRAASWGYRQAVLDCFAIEYGTPETPVFADDISYTLAIGEKQ